MICCSSSLRSWSRNAAFPAFISATSFSRLPGEDAGLWPYAAEATRATASAAERGDSPRINMTNSSLLGVFKVADGQAPVGERWRASGPSIQSAARALACARKAGGGRLHGRVEGDCDARCLTPEGCTE